MSDRFFSDDDYRNPHRPPPVGVPAVSPEAPPPVSALPPPAPVAGGGRSLLGSVGTGVGALFFVIFIAAKVIRILIQLNGEK